VRVIVVRHYRTLCNVSDEIMGWGDAPRARDWESDLAFIDNLLDQSQIQVDAIYSSYLERARQTAMYYAKSRGAHLIIRDTAQLNEINYGTALFRKSKAWVAKNIPWHKKDPNLVYPKGESFRQMQARSVEYILSQEDDNQNKTILVVAHAGVIRGLVSYMLNLDFATNLSRKVSHRYIGDFQIEGGVCVRYDELGELSGFIRDGVLVRVSTESTSIHRSRDTLPYIASS